MKYAWLVFVAACSSANPGHQSSGAGVSSDQQTLDFGSIAAGTAAMQKATLHSTGHNPLTILSVGITGDTRGAFATGGLPVTLAPGASAMLDVTYAAPAAAGSDTATLTIATNADDMPDVTIALSGTSLPEPVPLTVTLAGDGGGSVTSVPAGIACGSTCTANFAPGTMVTLTATPDGSSAFTGFSGACSGMTCTIDIASAASVTATFVKAYTLSVATTGSGSGMVTGGGISCTVTAGVGAGTCAVTVAEGTMIALTGTASTGSRFAGFTNACTGATTCSVTVNSNLLVDAQFIATYDVNITLAGDGGGLVTSAPSVISCSPTCSATFDVGASVQLFGTADGTSHFSGFSGDCSGASCNLTVDSTKNVTATFVKLVTVSVTASGAGSGSINGSGISCSATAGTLTGTCSVQVPEGTLVTLNASAGGNTTFGTWSGACSGASCSFIPAVDVTANAQFLALYTLSVTMAGTGTGTVTSTPAGISCTTGTCQHQFDETTNVSLAASTTGTNSFSGFSGGCTGSTCAFSPISATETVVATFASGGATYSIGGTVTGLSSNLVLSNNGTTLPISNNGTFAFTSQPAGYAVTVSTQPSSPAQTCTVTNGSGTATGAVTNIQIDCPPFAVASGLDHPSTLVRNGTTLYFARGVPPGVDCNSGTGAGDAVMLVPADGSSTPTKIADVDHSAGNCGVYGLVFDSTYVYWANYADGVIKKATLAGTGVATVYGGPTYLNSLAIDPTGGYLYYFAYSFGQIARVTTAGTGPQTFTSIGSINGINTTTDSTYLYWTDGLAGTLNKLAFAITPPGTPTQIVTSETNAIAPFVTGSTIYWVINGNPGAARYSSLSSPSAQPLASSLPTPASVVADASFAYVLVLGTSPNYNDGAILKIPVGGGTAVTIAKNLHAAAPLVLDATHVYFALDSTPGNSDGSIRMIVK